MSHVPLEVFWGELLDIASRREQAANTLSPELKTAIGAAADLRDVRYQRAKTATRESLPSLTDILTTCRRIGVNPLRVGHLFRAFREKRRETLQQRGEIDEKQQMAEARGAVDARPTSQLGLVGLALSGGGIRSATFNFGVLQALAAYGMLRHVDYFSTVSGGSYIGGCLSSVLTDSKFALDPDRFPFRQEPGHGDSPPVRRLRNSARYLATGGLIDRVRIPTLVFIGIIVNFLIVVPYLMIAACLTNWIYGEWVRLYRDSRVGDHRAMLIGQGLQEVIQGRLDPGHLAIRWMLKLRDWLANAVSGRVYLPEVTDLPLYTPTLTMIIVVVVSVLLFPLVRRATRSNWNLRNATEQAYTITLIILAVIIPVNTLPLAVAVYDRGIRWPGITQTVVTVLTALGPFVFAARKASGAATVREKLGIYIFGLVTPAVLVLVYVQLSYWLVRHRWNLSMLIAAVVLIALTWRVYDVNLTSLHGFYRDRLSKAFLFRLDSVDAVANDLQPLANLNGQGTCAPYHLINAAVNLQGSGFSSATRNADFFVFSKRFCGSYRTGYCATVDLERADAGLNLGTAVAISGAALAPNRGTGTVQSLVSVMTLLNVRTGYWLPNPRVVKKTSRSPISRWRWTGAGPLYFIHEMLGRLDEHRNYVNVSDGGHIENLGLYELLRRRCKFIVVSDAEEDPQLTFNGLARVMRYAKSDCGITIDINLDDLRGNRAGLSRGHYAIGRINYGEAGQGYLLYIKTSITGDESEDIKEYRARYSQFPHESTGQQFFNDGQFEAYRALGHHIGVSLFDEILPGGNTDTVLNPWVDTLITRSRER